MPSPLAVESRISPVNVRPAQNCPFGLGLREETVDLLLAHREQPALVMSPTSRLAEQVFPSLEGWIRVLGAPSLEMLALRAERAQRQGLPYEALAYGLETGKSTPDPEWQDLLGSTQAAREIADHYGKLLVLAPGLRLMSQNEELYSSMSALADIWILQTQRLQVYSPQSKYPQEVQRHAQLIRSGNPDIAVWVQITIPAGQLVDASSWLPYYDAIVDLVDGAYLGLYTWDLSDEEEIIETMETIYVRVCGSQE